MKLVYEKIRDNAKSPTKAYPDDACWDLYCTEEVSFPLGGIGVANTGLRFSIPKGYAIQVYSRSGLAKKGIAVHNAPGVIDSGYTGELSVILFSNYICTLPAGSKVAQFRLVKLENYCLCEGVVDTNTERGSNGFGSSGV